MFIPIGDEPNARAVPVVNYALIAINVIVFALISLPLMAEGVDPRDPMVQALLQELARQHPHLDPYTLLQQLGRLSAYDVFLMRWGYRAAEPTLVTLVTAMFLHGGWLHVIGNMLFLWIYGDNVEHRLGHLGYLGAYLVAGAAATLAYAAVLPEAAGHTPLVGASGAISGVVGCYFVWFPRNKVRLLIALLPFYVDVWKVSARVVLGVYVILDNLLPLLLAPARTSGVAYGAHLGGFLAGAAGAVMFDRLAVRRRRKGDARDSLDAAMDLYHQALSDPGRGPGLDRALLGIGLVLLERGEPARAYQDLARVLAMDPAPEVADRARQALAAIAGQQKLQVRSRRWPSR